MGTPMDYSTIEDGYQYIKVFHEVNSSNGMLLLCKNDKDNNGNNDDTGTISSSLNEEQEQDTENSVDEQQEKDRQQSEDKVTTWHDDDNDNTSSDKLLVESPTKEAQSKNITLEAHLIKTSPQVTADTDADTDADTLSECNTNENWLSFMVQKGVFLFMVTMPLILFVYDMYSH